MVEENIGEEEILHGPFPVEQLQEAGVASVDLKKLKYAGLCTIEDIAYSPQKQLLLIKGISDAKVDKIIEAVEKLVPLDVYTLISVCYKDVIL
ncbi:hypothetical protein MKX03_011285 [Papaver bracteatum]|nr:hypothetical protein MKX03_011285 [Papaver bracteatum]